MRESASEPFNDKIQLPVHRREKDVSNAIGFDSCDGSYEFLRTTKENRSV
jgi:hypothetical protein